MKSAFFLKKLMPIVAVIILFSTVSLFAQQTIHLEYLEIGQFVKVELKDGQHIEGRVNKVDENTIILKISVGELKLHRTDIKTISLFDPETQKELNQKYKLSEEYAISKIAGTKGILFPTAYPLAKGKAYYQNSYIFINMFGYGLTKNFSISGGFEAFSTFTTIYTPILLFSPKARFKLADDLYAGVWAIMVLYDGDLGYTTFGMLTYGNKDNNITFSTNVPFANISHLDFDDDSFNNAFSLNAQLKINRKLSLISDNYLVQNKDVYYDEDEFNSVHLFGIRVKRESSSFDFALMTNDEANGVFLPYVSYTLGF